MTQDERWLTKYNELMEFMETNHRNPSRHRIEEHDMLNWLKATRKRMNAGELKENRVELFQKLLEFGEKYKKGESVSVINLESNKLIWTEMMP